MLLREDFSRRHERNLVPVFYGDDCGLESHDRFARSHVSLQQPPHQKRLLHVGGDFVEHPLLSLSVGSKGRISLNGLAYAVVEFERDSSLGFLLAAFRARVPTPKRNILQRSARTCAEFREGLEILRAARRGVARCTRRSASRGEMRLSVAAHRGWHQVRRVRGKVLQSAMNDAAKPARHQTPVTGRLIQIGSDLTPLPERKRLSALSYRPPLRMREGFRTGAE